MTREFSRSLAANLSLTLFAALSGGCTVMLGLDGTYVLAACSDGEPWSRPLGGEGKDTLGSIAIDASGNVVVAGSFTGTANFGGATLTSVADIPDMFVVKYSPCGEHLWSRRFGSDRATGAWEIAIDDSGDIIVAGVGYAVDFGGGPVGMGPLTNILVAKLLGADGGHVWSKGFPGTHIYDYPSGVAVDIAGDVILGGLYNGTLNLGDDASTALTSAAFDGYIGKLSGVSGAHLWSASVTGEHDEEIRGVGTDKDGDIVIAGTFKSQAVSFGSTIHPNVAKEAATADMFIAKLARYDGGPLWSKTYGTPGDDYATRLAVDALGDVVVAGRVGGAIDLGGGPIGITPGLSLAKYVVADGSHVWSWAFNSDAYGVPYSTRVAVDAAGATYLASIFESPQIEVGGGPLKNPGAPTTEVFLAKYAPTIYGDYLFSTAFNSGDSDEVRGLAVSPVTGNVVIAGTFHSAIIFGNNSIVSAGNLDVFLASLGPIPPPP